MKKSELKIFRRKVLQYNTLDFIEVIPFKYHISTSKEDIGISKRNNRMGEPYYDYKILTMIDG
jgi:hypothetical protein